MRVDSLELMQSCAISNYTKEDDHIPEPSVGFTNFSLDLFVMLPRFRGAALTNNDRRKSRNRQANHQNRNSHGKVSVNVEV